MLALLAVRHGGRAVCLPPQLLSSHIALLYCSTDPGVWRLYYTAILEAHEEGDSEGVKELAQRLVEGR